MSAEKPFVEEKRLNIGCGANLEPDPLFTGLIDDVRIDNRAVRP
jgi:hypothetical protein